MPTVRRERIADYMLACLLLTPKKVVLRNHRLVFVHAGENFTYADADSEVMKLAEGTELLGYYDASRPNVLHVTDHKGGYVGAVRRRGAIDIRDQAAISAEAGEITRLIRTCVVGPVRERHAAEDKQLSDDRAHNQALLEQARLVEPLSTDARPSASRANKTPGDNADTGDKPARQGLSKLLGRDRTVVAPAAAGLALGIADEVGKADVVAARAAAVKRHGEELSAEDLQDLGHAPAAPLQTPPTPADDASFNDIL